MLSRLFYVCLEGLKIADRRFQCSVLPDTEHLKPNT